jgi:ribonuclease E
MPKKMLIDASHPEETRVVIVDGHRIEDFDFESVSKKPLKGNIYLAKVTRVEPSLQASFVEYGGNRHGFLAFTEIHPDYYQIPVADRQALIEAQKVERSFADDGDDDERPANRRERARFEPDSFEPSPSVDEDPSPFTSDAEPVSNEFKPESAYQPEDRPETPPEFEPIEAVDAEFSDEVPGELAPSREDLEEPGAEIEPSVSEGSYSTLSSEGLVPDALSIPAEGLTEPGEGNVSEIQAEPVHIDTVGGEEEDDDALEEMPTRPPARNYRPYKIQEVIKRRQVMLVQVVKEERGNKGAALTSYLSLAGRYCVLMPNTPRGGGISRKITNQNDRRRLKEIAAELDVPEGMGVIIRTAGASRTRQEIRRDYEYLLRLWESVREMTLKSTAPALIYEEGDIIKRGIRDSFTKDIDEVLVQGREAYENAKAFMRMLMPAQAKAVQLYEDRVPLFQAFRVENYLDSMFSPKVQLRSGGYIVINATEALVAIDVNSGRATREHTIEETALKTNLEAAEEISRQLRLRDLAGLIVIDFIDMEEGRNNRSVEKRLKDCLRHDRARIQVGRISPFGLLEMSRQRLRAGVVEGSTIQCPHCSGTGAIRSVESMALRVLRGIEEDGQKFRERAVTVKVPSEVALYILNQKRYELSHIEARANLTVFVEAKSGLLGADYEITPGVPSNFRPRRTLEGVIGPQTVLSEDEPVEPLEEPAEIEETVDAELGAEASELEEPSSGDEERADEGRGPKRRRRGRGRERERERRPEGRRDRQPRAARAEKTDEPAPIEVAVSHELGEAVGPTNGSGHAEESADANERRRRRRGRRGGRRHRRERSGPGLPEAIQMGDDAVGEVIGDASPTLPNEPLFAPELPTADLARSPAIEARVERQSRSRSEETAPAPLQESAEPKEAKSERSTLATFFGFGSRSSEQSVETEEPRERATGKKGWWQKR